MPTPMTPPTMQCLGNVSFFFPALFSVRHQAYVVDTGRPILVAKVKNVEDATKAHVMPNMSTVGSASKNLTLMILFRMVSATRALFPSIWTFYALIHGLNPPHQDGTEKFTDGGNIHGLPEGQGSRRHRGCKRIRHIVGSDVEGVQKGEDHAQGKDVVELMEGHLVGCSMQIFKVSVGPN